MEYSREEFYEMDTLPVGLVFNNFTVLSFEGGEPHPDTGTIQRHNQIYRVKCNNCGKEHIKRRNDFLNSSLNYCRNCPKEFKKAWPTVLEEGMEFGFLTVINSTPIRQYTKEGTLKPLSYSKYKCHCSACGKTTEKLRGNLLSGHTISCGCLRHKMSAEVCRKTNTYEVIEEGTVAKVEITNKPGQYFYLYLEDWNRFKGSCWSLQVRGYISAGSTWTKNVRMLHREIAEAEEGEVVDHIDGDPMNNRRDNLRVCTQGNNAINRYKSYNEIMRIRELPNGNFSASITKDGEFHYLGTYTTREQANQARFEGELKYFGKYSPILCRKLYEKYNLIIPEEYSCLLDELDEKDE